MDLILPHIEINRYPSFKMEHSCAWYCIFLDYVVRYCKIFDFFLSKLQLLLCIYFYFLLQCDILQTMLHLCCVTYYNTLFWTTLLCIKPTGGISHLVSHCTTAFTAWCRAILCQAMLECNASQWIALHCMHCSTAWRCRPVPWWWNLPMDSLSEQAGN